ncbi:MAG: GAF domain-containing protein [Bacteroidales bacterium]|nr:GAF domain-containing protein [Bacteroidales bacterium]
MKGTYFNKLVYCIWIIVVFHPVYSQYNEIKFQHLTVNDGLSQNTVRFIEQDKYGFIWLGTFQGLNRYDGYDFKIYSMNPDDTCSLTSNRIQTTYIDSIGNLWVRTPDGYVHLYNYELDNFTRFPPGKCPPDIDSALQIQENSVKVLTYKNHRFIFTYGSETSRMFEYVDLNTGKSTISEANPFDPTSLHDNYLLDIFLDKDYNLWVGSFSNGVSVADLNRKPFNHYKRNPNETIGIIDNNIRPIYIDEKGIMWIGTRDKGITRFDRKNNTYKNYQHDPQKNSIVGNDIRCIYKDNYGYMWFGTKQGLDYFDPQTETFYNVIMGNVDINWVFGVNEDSHKNLWICTFGGLCKFNRNNKSLKVYNESDGTIINNYLRFFHEDKLGYFWVGSENGGITRLNKINSIDEFEDKFESRHFIHDPLDTNSLSSNRVYVMCEDENGKLWFGTGNGINVFNRETATFLRITSADGLSNDMIVGLLSDLNGYIWASHKRGISRIDNKTYQIMNFDTHDGLQANEFNEDAYFFNLKTREMFFGGPNGINYFYPDSIKENNITPSVFITKLEINDKEVKINKEVEGSVILTKNIILTPEIRLNHRHKRIAIEFTALHFSNPQKNQFKYMLEGFEDKDDDKWINASAENRRAVYSNLKPKKYIFKVMASNPDGVWCKQPATLTIIVRPPWWKTWGFRIVVIILLIGSSILFYQLRMYQLKKQKHVLENKVEQRTEQIKQANTLLEKQKQSIEKSLVSIQTLSKFGQQLTSTLELASINKMVFDYVSNMMEVTNFAVGVYKKKEELLEFSYFIENGNPLPPFNSSLSDKTSCGAWCFNNQKMIFSNHFLDEYPKFIDNLNIRTSEVPKSVIYFPLTTKKSKIGIVTIQSNKENAYSEYEKAIIQNLASYLSIALDNANVYQELAKKNKELTNQTVMLNETNSLLEERQQLIEEQSEELKAKTEELSKTNKKLNQLVATKDKFFSIIAHDLKNPFSSILGFARLLKIRYNVLEEEKKIRFIDSILSSASNLYALLENLLDWSRTQMGSVKYEPEIFSLNEIIKLNIDLVDNMLHIKGNEIKTDIPPDTYIYADKNMINTIIRNLLTNAIKFTEKGTISIIVREESKFAVTHIIDTGSGIEQEKLANLFNIGAVKSTPGTKNESGTGLGLIICKEFIRKNGGELYVESRVGKGSDFYFTVPSTVGDAI